MQKILGFLRLIISVMFDFGPLSDSGISRGRKVFGLLLNRLVGSRIQLGRPLFFRSIMPRSE